MSYLREKREAWPRRRSAEAHRVPRHRAVAIVALPLLAGGRADHRMGVARSLAAERPHEAPHTGVPAREALLIDEVLPDRHGVAAAGEGQFEQLAVGLAGTGGRGPAGRRRPRRPARPGDSGRGSVDTSLAGFGGGRRRRGSRIAIPAALR